MYVHFCIKYYAYSETVVLFKTSILNLIDDGLQPVANSFCGSTIFNIEMISVNYLSQIPCMWVISR